MYSEQTKNIVRELIKHALRDDCYNCKQLVRAMGLKLEDLAIVANAVKETLEPFCAPVTCPSCGHDLHQTPKGQINCQFCDKKFKIEEKTC